MSQTKTIIVHKALDQKWEESDEYQGYVPENLSWKEVLDAFVNNSHGINKPLAVRLQKNGSRLSVLICEYKPAGELLPLSDKNTPREATFVLCELCHVQKKIIIHI